ncbi:hypothetical protein CN601_16975 [Bacillus sp. AFS017336]|nr:hypothetical protein CN692_12195 [Bacillus sp. AFS002410]PEL08412.1 hypothetical protein CN601_16975 [Bacillus sp. AFS017336]
MAEKYAIGSLHGNLTGQFHIIDRYLEGDTSRIYSIATTFYVIKALNLVLKKVTRSSISFETK